MSAASTAVDAARGATFWPIVLRLGLVLLAVSIIWYVRSQIAHQRDNVFEVPQSVVVVHEHKEEEPPPEEPEEQIVDDTTQVQQIETAEAPPPDVPMAIDDALGLDAEGLAGSDGFGLLAKRGGRSLLLTGDRMAGEAAALYRSYAGTLRQFIQTELIGYSDLRRENYTADIALWIDPAGRIARCEIRRSSRNAEVDARLRDILLGLPPMRAPPQDMPQPIRMRISTSGGRGA